MYIYTCQHTPSQVLCLKMTQLTVIITSKAFTHTKKRKMQLSIHKKKKNQK